MTTERKSPWETDMRVGSLLSESEVRTRVDRRSSYAVCTLRIVLTPRQDMYITHHQERQSDLAGPESESRLDTGE